MSKTRTIARLRRRLTGHDATITTLRHRIAELESVVEELEYELEATADSAMRYQRDAARARAAAEDSERSRANYEYWVSEQARKLDKYERYGDTYHADKVRQSLERGW
jgi:septal ring factor EnvC (AmiA/AmiB activator)